MYIACYWGDFVFITIDLKRLIYISAVIFLVAFIVLGLFYKRSEAAESVSINDGHTLVIDAGHGGVDGGAVSKSGLKESDINLAIAEKTEAISRFLGQNTVMTRSSDTDFYGGKSYSEHDNLIKRAQIADNEHDPVLISIHQNTFPSELVRGAEVMYAKTSGSESLGLIMQDNLTQYADPDNRRVARPAPDDLLLTRSVHCPAVLIECGFLSNPEEALMLSDSSYQLKLAAVIAASYIQYKLGEAL